MLPKSTNILDILGDDVICFRFRRTAGFTNGYMQPSVYGLVGGIAHLFYVKVASSPQVHRLRITGKSDFSGCGLQEQFHFFALCRVRQWIHVHASVTEVLETLTVFNVRVDFGSRGRVLIARSAWYDSGFMFCDSLGL